MELGEERGQATSQALPGFPGPDPQMGGFLDQLGSQGMEQRLKGGGPEPGHPVSMARDDL